MREIIEFIHYTSHSLFVVLIRSQTWTRYIESNWTWNLKFTRPSPMFPWFRLPLPAAVRIYTFNMSWGSSIAACGEHMPRRAESPCVATDGEKPAVLGRAITYPGQETMYKLDVALLKKMLHEKMKFSVGLGIWSRGGREDSEEGRGGTRRTRTRSLCRVRVRVASSAAENEGTLHLMKQLRSHTGAN